MPLVAIFGGMVVAGALVAIVSFVALRRSGADVGVARRLAGPEEWPVGRLPGAPDLPGRPVRVAGRIRCRDPLDAGGGERLVAFHRDVEVLVGRHWRSIERLRETRSFELWDHDGSAPLDPADAAEPLITIPTVWEGSPAELSEPHAGAARRLAERHGPTTRARSVTRTVNVTDRLLVLARVERDPAGIVILRPPDGGYLVSAVALDDAMRLLGGTNRRAAALGVIGVAVAIALGAIGVIGSIAAAVAG